MNRSFKTTFNFKKQSFDKIIFKKEKIILPINFNEKNALLTSTFNNEFYSTQEQRKVAY